MNFFRTLKALVLIPTILTTSCSTDRGLIEMKVKR